MENVYHDTDEVVIQLNLISKKLDSDITEEDKWLWKELASRYKRLGRIKEYGGRWMVAVYDKGKCLGVVRNHWHTAMEIY